MGQNSFWISIAPSFVQTAQRLEWRSISISATLQIRELVDKVTCIVDANHSLLPCIFLCINQKCLTVYLQLLKKKLNYERIQFRLGIEPGSAVWQSREDDGLMEVMMDFQNFKLLKLFS